MKKIIILLFFFLSGLNLSIAQVSEEERTMTQGANNALIMMIHNAEDDFVEKRWKKFMKSNGAKTKKIRKSEEWLSGGSDISGLGSSVNVYAVFEQSGSDVRMTTWFDMDGTYLSSSKHSGQFSAGEDFLNEFESHVYKEGVKIEIKGEENNMKKLKSEMKKLKKNNEKYHREIEAAKKKIAKAEEDIEVNLTEQEEMKIKIEEQLKVVEKTKQKMEVRENN